MKSIEAVIGEKMNVMRLIVSGFPLVAAAAGGSLLRPEARP